MARDYIKNPTNGGGKIRKNTTPTFNEMTTEEIQEHFIEQKDQRKSRKGMSLKDVSLDEIHDKLLNVLLRDTDHLLHASVIGKLNANDSNSLTNYLKLMRELKKIQTEEEENKTDEELEKLANESSTSEEDTSET